jgi:hypothetical protein
MSCTSGDRRSMVFAAVMAAAASLASGERRSMGPPLASADEAVTPATTKVATSTRLDFMICIADSL